MDDLGRSAFNWAKSLLVDPHKYATLACLVIAGDALLTQLIIRFIPYTEIDWETYMYQVAIIQSGERNYSKVTGPTGPLVYPAGHVHIHRLLSKFTNEGLAIQVAQQIYGALYLVSLSISAVLYSKANAPNWILLLLPISKRLHSIFVLRLFNDCWATVIMQIAILAFSQGYDYVGTIAFSFALSVKMSILLYSPAIAIILLKRGGLFKTLACFSAVALIQVALSWEFLSNFPWVYLKGSFDFSRQFLYQWTVNWKMLPEEIFLSSQLAGGLLACHAITLLILGQFFWCRPEGGLGRLLLSALRHPAKPPSKNSPTSEDVIVWMLACNLVGIVFSRSLHYQFYSWYAYQVPFFVHKSRAPLILRLACLAGVELAWNTYPATWQSSTVLLSCNLFFLCTMLPAQTSYKRHR